MTLQLNPMTGVQDDLSLLQKLQSLEAENLQLKNHIVEISRSKELYLKIFEDFPALIWRSGLDMGCDYFNNTWLDFTGRTLEEEVGNGWVEGVHPDDVQKCMDIYIDSFKKREAFVMEYRLLNAKREYCWIRDFGRPFYDMDNSFLGYLGSCYDITSIKNIENDLQELIDAREKFFAIIGHDLKNPINSIVCLAEMLYKKIKNKEFESIEEYSKNIHHSSTRIKTLLVNLLEWSVAHKGKMGYRPANVHLNIIIQEVIDLMQETLHQKSVRVECSLLDEDTVLIDKEMISTILRNFLSNAIKYSHKNSSIHISSKRKDNRLMVSIKDEGVGMSEQTLQSLFKIGETVSSKGTSNETGTGIGLIICKEFLEQHESKLEAKSELGKGSEFRFCLPIA